MDLLWVYRETLVWKNHSKIKSLLHNSEVWTWIKNVPSCKIYPQQ